MQPIAPRRRNRAKCSYRLLQWAKMFTPPSSIGEMFIPPTKRRVYLERHGGDVTRVNSTRHNRHDATLGTQSTNTDSAPSYGMVQKWFTQFLYGRTSTETIPSLGSPNKITTSEMINKIHDIVLNDLKVKVHICAWESSVQDRCRNFSQSTKNAFVWPLRSKIWPIFNLFYPKEFLRRFVTMDETWIHHYTPESEERSKQWVKVECKSHPRTNGRVTWSAVELCRFENISWIHMVEILVRYWLRIHTMHVYV